MGEYARQYTLEQFGVDIGETPDSSKPVLKKYGCKCGRMFTTLTAKEQHQFDKHGITNAKHASDHPPRGK